MFGFGTYGWASVYLLRDILIMSIFYVSGLAISVLNLLLGFGLLVEWHFSYYVFVLSKSVCLGFELVVGLGSVC